MNTQQATLQTTLDPMAADLTTQSKTRRRSVLTAFVISGSLAGTAIQTTIFASGLLHTIAAQAVTMCR